MKLRLLPQTAVEQQQFFRIASENIGFRPEIMKTYYQNNKPLSTTGTFYNRGNIRLDNVPDWYMPRCYIFSLSQFKDFQ